MINVPSFARKSKDAVPDQVEIGRCGRECEEGFCFYNEPPKLRKYKIDEIYRGMGAEIDETKKETLGLPFPDRVAFRLTTFYELMFRYEAKDPRVTSSQYKESKNKIKRFQDRIDFQKDSERKQYLEEIDEIACRQGSRLKDLEVGPGTLGEKLLYLEKRIREKESQADKYLKIFEKATDGGLAVGTGIIVYGVTDNSMVSIGSGLLTFVSGAGKYLANRWYDGKKKRIEKEYRKVINCKRELDDHRKDIRENVWDESLKTFKRYYREFIELA